MTLAFVRRFGTLFILSAWSSFQWPASAQYTGTLIIEALTSTGKPIDEFHATLFTRGIAQRREAVGSRLVFDGLHAERYRVQVRSKGYMFAEHFVTVVPGETWLPIVLQLDIPICYTWPHRLRGRVVTTGSPSQLWLKLVSVFEGKCLHARLDAAGNFALSGMPPGKYFLFVYSRDRIFHETIVTIPRVDSSLLLIFLDP